MSVTKQCPSCGRELEGDYQFCPFDRTLLGRKCPVCGKVWDASFQFCPIDSTELGERLTPEPPPPEPSRPAPPPPLPPPVVSVVERPRGSPQPLPPVDLSSFTEHNTGRNWKSTLFRPVTLIFIFGVLIVGAFVFFLTASTGGPDLPVPVVKYEVLPNEGRSKGVAVAIRVNQLAVFLIDDPMEGGATRAQKIVSAIEEVMRNAHSDVGLRFAVEMKDGRPAILVVTQAGPDPRVLASVTEGDAAIAGETDATRVAGRWAERLTDAVKVFVFGEAPTFSKGTEFGESLSALFKAAVGERGHITKKSLDRAYQQLSPAQRQALETPPRVK
jgi:hypothetical protein